MRKSMFLLGAAALALAACGSDDKEANPADAAANAANAAGNAAGTAANAAGNATTNGSYEAANPGGKAKGAHAKAAQHKGQSKVEFRGCTRLVRVEKRAGCMVVGSGSASYDIDSARPRPAADRMISGRGVYDPKTVGICPGKYLTKVEWRYTGGRCPAGKP